MKVPESVVADVDHGTETDARGVRPPPLGLPERIVKDQAMVGALKVHFGENDADGEFGGQQDKTGAEDGK